jgi:uncharacterized membrane protein
MADSSRQAQRPRPRIESLTDLVFGLALSIGAISLISNKPADSGALAQAIAAFGFSFLILIQIWFRFTEIMSVLPIETAGTRVLNSILLFLVALEPYLFNILGFFMTPQPSGPVDAASSIYALDIGAIYGILAMFTNILATEERKLVAPGLLRKYRLSRDLEILVAIIFLVSAIPQLWTLNDRYYIWATTFFVYRGGSIMRGLRKSSPTATP